MGVGKALQLAYGIALTAAVLLSATRHPAARQHPTARQYRHAAIGKEAGVRAAGHAAMGTLTDTPHEWGKGPGGFAKRAGSSLGQHAVKGTIQLAVGAWHHENLHYQRSNLDGKWPRLKYAVKSTFIVPRTDRKGKTVALGRISGNMGAGMISRVWQPASAAGVGAGLASGGIGLGADVGANVAREFWPRKRSRQLKRRRKS